MTIIGIDVGLSKTGVAYATPRIAEPLLVIHDNNKDTLVEKIVKVVRDKDVDLVVVGMPQGALAATAKDIGEALKNQEITVEFWDETLTTQEAQRLAREAGLKRKKRRELEDAFAAAVMLQSYIESQGSGVS
ncbi:Holliday junction resolvase RuvX [Candidatus Microgenomates bacterium]|nr:Holliday junction resolvase RuvX [Candidatus Microgenomates bacterium]